MNAPKVRAVDGDEMRQLIPALADILVDCVAGDASVSFMAPYGMEEAMAFWEKVADAAGKDQVSVLVAEVDGIPRGTVQIAYDLPPNQPHRGEVRKLLVHRSARGRGLGRALMTAAETVAAARGKSLLCLDTASPAAGHIYTELGWTRVGVIPDFALLPKGGFCDTVIFYKRLR
ncbi:MAG: GNAT family N-acetyltransferase [Bauldia sp.]